MIQKKTFLRVLFSPRARGIFFVLPFVFVCSASAKDISFEISTDSPRVVLGESLRLNLSFDGAQDIPGIELGAIEGFQAQYLGPSTRMSIVNGQASSSITHIYELLPLKTGVFKIGPLKFSHKGNFYISNALELEVVQDPGSLRGQDNTVGGISPDDIKDRAFLVVNLGKNRAYLNEVIPLSIKMYVNNLSVKGIEYPLLNSEGISLGKFQKPRQYKENIGGVYYDVIEFTSSLFALRTGEFKIGPASLKCNLIIRSQKRSRGLGDFEDFFDSGFFGGLFDNYRAYPLKLESIDLPLTISALPEENRPAYFSGAIGNFNLELQASPLEVKAGDPITIKGRISGEGNFAAVSAPKMDPASGFKVYEPQTKMDGEGKTFEQVIIPLEEGISQIPAFRFSFFSPEKNKYQTIAKGPLSLTVLKQEKPDGLKIVEPNNALGKAFKERESLGRDIVYIKTRMGGLRKSGVYLYKNGLFLWTQALPLFVFLFLYIVYSRKRRLDGDVRYVRQLRAPRQARAGIRKAEDFLKSGRKMEFYDAIFQTLQEYLGNKFHLFSKSITVSVVEDIAYGESVSPQIINKLKDIFRGCDMARYAASDFGADNMRGMLKELEEVIDYFQRHKARPLSAGYKTKNK